MNIIIKVSNKIGYQIQELRILAFSIYISDSECRTQVPREHKFK